MYCNASHKNLIKKIMTHELNRLSRVQTNFVYWYRNLKIAFLLLSEYNFCLYKCLWNLYHFCLIIVNFTVYFRISNYIWKYRVIVAQKNFRYKNFMRFENRLNYISTTMNEENHIWHIFVLMPTEKQKYK